MTRIPPSEKRTQISDSPMTHTEESSPEMVEVHYLLRYLPPKTQGEGEIVAAISASELALKDWRKKAPNLFSQPGFYTLAIATGETLTVEGTSISSTPAATDEAERDALKAAYIAGATDVHVYWRAGGSDAEPDFAEAASDYAADHAAALSPAIDEVEVAALVHGAMVYAVNHFKGEPQPWQNGNSHAEHHARVIAGQIATAKGDEA